MKTTLSVANGRRAVVTKALLVCGILSSFWYILINIYVPLQYEGYKIASTTVSELSAIGAPTRKLWVTLAVPYPILFAAFGWGVLKTADNNKLRRAIGILIIGYAIFNLYWPPMHMRGAEPTLTDGLHITWAIATVLLMITMMVLGAMTFGKQFRVYTIVSILLLIDFGVLTGIESPNIPTNGPTPMIGIWERINIGVFMVWMTVLATVLVLRHDQST